MMNAVALSSSELNFATYASILRSANLGVAVVVVCDAGGEVVWCDDEGMERAAQQPLSVHLADRAVTEVESFGVEGGGRICVSPVITDSSDVAGYVAALCDRDAAQDGRDTPSGIESLLSNVASCMRVEFGMSMELNAMADELSERYEELNLVYDTDVGNGDQTAIHKSLRRLVKSCSTFLELEVVTLVLPDKNIAITHYHNRVNPCCMKTNFDDSIADYFFEKAMNASSGVVLNDPDEVLRETGKLTAKVLLSPVVSGNSDVIGALVCVRCSDDMDYTNSDRNLIDVVSRKVTQVIQTNYDALTGLLNRSGYESNLAELLDSSQRKGRVHTVLNVDLDDLQVINETIGYDAGDSLLMLITKVMTSHLRDTDIISRVGGDEFGVLLENCPLEEGVSVARKLLDAINDTVFAWNGSSTSVSSTVGLTEINSDSESVTSIISEVEVALDAAKDQGKNRIQVYKKEDEELARRKEEMKWVGRIKDALMEERFQLFSQPIVPINSGDQPHHVEILLRMLDTEGNIVTPFSFIPAAEHYHLMPEIDRWVITNTLSRLSEHYRNSESPSASVAINLSGQSLAVEGFLDFVLQKVQQCEAPAAHIGFEVTESAAIANFDDAIHFIGKVRELGCPFSLDDFGAGLSSFAYLKDLPVDHLKIDGAFIKDILTDKVSEAMVTAINQVGQVMGLKTIAEYVENDEIKRFLQTVGIDYAQGYGVGKPRPFEEYLQERAE